MTPGAIRTVCRTCGWARPAATGRGAGPRTTKAMITAAARAAAEPAQAQTRGERLGGGGSSSDERIPERAAASTRAARSGGARGQGISCSRSRSTRSGSVIVQPRQRPLQQRPRPRQPRLDRADVHLEGLRDLLVTQAVKLAQQERRAKVGAQPLDGAEQGRPQLL